MNRVSSFARPGLPRATPAVSAALPATGEGAAPAARDGWLTEALLRVFALAVSSVAVVNLMGAWWADHSRWTVLLLGVFESVTWGLVLFARRAQRRDLSPWAMAQTGFAALYFVLMTPLGAVHLVGEAVGVAFQAVGAVFQFSAKLVLGRSFGLLPARRSVVTAGPYRLVRHPVYLGYLVGHLGFLLTNFSLRNAGVLAALYAVQALRIRREEAVLAGDAAYRDYQRQVRWRMVPGVY